MPKPKVSIKNGQTIHYSVGVVVMDGRGNILLIDRATPPFGLAGVAGHVDEGEEPSVALKREVQEEIGLVLVEPELLYDEFIDWNWCSAKVMGHHWYLYQGVVTGQPVIQEREVNSVNWYPMAELANLKLEPVWEYWFKKLGYLNGA